MISLFLLEFQELSDQWSKEKDKLLSAFRRLVAKNNVQKGNIGDEVFFKSSHYSVLIQVLSKTKDKDFDIFSFDNVDSGNEKLQTKYSCCICETIVSSPKDLGLHIFQKHTEETIESNNF